VEAEEEFSKGEKELETHVGRVGGVVHRWCRCLDLLPVPQPPLPVILRRSLLPVRLAN
jgi:hypothetical protein